MCGISIIFLRKLISPKIGQRGTEPQNFKQENCSNAAKLTILTQ